MDSEHERMMIPTLMEFAVEMKDDISCVADVKRALEDEPGIRVIDIDFEKNHVLLETTIPSGRVHELLESSGKTTVFRGHGHAGESGHSAAAVAHVFGKNINGLVRFVQTSDDTCIIDGTIDGLSEGKHAVHINEFGDLSEGCNSTGNCFNGTIDCHEDRPDAKMLVGQLGNIVSNSGRRAFLRIQDNRFKVQDVIGRSLVINQREDTALPDINKGVACGIIARSAGVFENRKMICQCSGQTLWEERRASTQTATSQL